MCGDGDWLSRHGGRLGGDRRRLAGDDAERVGEGTILKEKESVHAVSKVDRLATRTGESFGEESPRDE